MMSGPFTPAAVTFTSTSFFCGVGTGRSVGFNTSGLPGAEISTAFIVLGRVIYRNLSLAVRDRYAALLLGVHAAHPTGVIPLASWRLGGEVLIELSQHLIGMRT